MTARRSMLLIIIASLLITLVMPFGPLLAEAHSGNSTISAVQQGTGDCIPFDLVFLVDQSSSMAAIENGGAGNDPDNQRIESVRWVIRTLGFQDLTICENDVVNRVAVIPFGTNVDRATIMPLTTISPESEEAWTEQQNQLVNLVNPADLTGTHFADAFAMAKDVLNNAPALGDVSTRKRAIVLITDGTPCGGNMTIEECASPTAISNYMTALEAQITSDFNPAAYYLWVIGINRYSSLPPDAQSFYNVAIRHWEQIVARYLPGSSYRQLGNSENEIPVAFVQILETLSPTGALDITCQPVPVDPYQESVRFSFFRNTANNPVTLILRNSDNQEVLLQNGEVLENGGFFDPAKMIYWRDGLNESYLFKQPIPGVWEVTMANATSCEELRARFITIQARAQRVAPTGALPQYPDHDLTGKYYEPNPADQYHLAFEIIDRHGDRLPSYGNSFPIQAAITIKSPNGEEFTRGLTQDEGAIFWRTDEPLPTNEVGRYEYAVEGTAVNARGDGILTIIHDSGSYDVVPIKRFSWHIVSPRPQEQQASSVGLGCPSGSLVRVVKATPNPLNIVVRVTDYTGPNVPFSERQSIDPATVMDVTGTTYSATLTTPNENTQPITVTLLPIDQTDPSLYGATIPGESLEIAGNYTLTVNRDAILKEGWVQRDVLDQATFIRVPNSMANAFGCNCVLGVLGTMLVALVTWFVANTSGKPEGFLVFENSRGEEIADPIPVRRFWRKTTISGGSLGGIAGFMPVTQITVERGPGKHASEEEASVIINITGKDDDGRKVVFLRRKRLINCQDTEEVTDGFYVRYMRFGAC